jgi:acetate kinase
VTSESANILVLNSGSSSLKFGLFRHGLQDEEMLLQGSAEGIGRESGSLRIRDAKGAVVLDEEHVLESQPDALKTIASTLSGRPGCSVEAVGHRIVHGGPSLWQHQRITPEVVDTLRAAIHFAPLHIPLALALIEQAEQVFPAPQFGCFDTAFHRTMPEAAYHLPLPARYLDQGVRRYGFHGLSCESVLHQLGATLPSRVIVAHLGNGASVTAIRDGRSVDTTMGLTPTGGIVMGTRSGDLDPGVLLYLMRVGSLDADSLERLVNHECGLAGLSGGESDMQMLLHRCDAGDRAARLAVEVFCGGVRQAIGAFVALLGGVDLLVFTGGIGEHSATVREWICTGLESMGIPAGGEKEGNVVAVASQEEIQIARHVRALLGPGWAPERKPAATGG